MSKVRSALIGRLKSYVQQRIISEGKITEDKADWIVDQLYVSDRLTVLTVCFYLEDSLREALARHLPQGGEKIFADRGLLSSFDSRLTFAHAMGLMDDPARDDINLMREIRNAAAHAYANFSFSEAAIADVALSIQATSDRKFRVEKIEGREPPKAALIRYVWAGLHYSSAFQQHRPAGPLVTPTSATSP